MNYDGEIYIENKLVEKVEITCPLLGKKDNDDAKEMNKYGYTTPEVGCLDKALTSVKDKIINKAINKNQNKHYDNSITLVVYLNDDIHFFDRVELCTNTLKELKNILMKEKYRFKNVYILQNINNKYKLEKIK